MIYIAGQQFNPGPLFSSRFRLISGMISGAAQWLEWAVSDKDFDLSVDSEGEMLTKIQEGLHGSGLMCLNHLNLLVHPLCLAQMNEDDLAVLASGHKKAVSEVLSEYALMTGDDLSEASRILKEFGLSGYPVFQAMTLSDQIRLSNLVRGEVDAEEKTAANFAIQDAQTPLEFAERYRFFNAAKNKIRSNISKTAKKNAVIQAWDNLSPLCNRLLETICLNRSAYDRDLSPLIRSSLEFGTNLNLGFLSKASAMRHIMEHTHILKETGLQAVEIINSHMSEVKAVISEGLLHGYSISQDGMNRSFVYKLSDKSLIRNRVKTVTINVDVFGVVTIHSCQY